MYHHFKVSVVMPAYNEEMSIEHVIKDFSSLKFVDEIIVVDNNSTDKTSELAKKLGCKVFYEKKQGWGYAFLHAMKKATGDLIILVESDCTFRSKGVLKLIQYIDDVDMVIGSRTYRFYSHPDANMNAFIRCGEYFLGKLTQLLYHNVVSLNDMGCSFRIIKRKAMKKFIDDIKIKNRDFASEVTVKALNKNVRIIQIPIKYMPRKGESKLSQNIGKSFLVGLKHIYGIFSGKFFSD